MADRAEGRVGVGTRGARAELEVVMACAELERGDEHVAGWGGGGRFAEHGTRVADGAAGAVVGVEAAGARGARIIGAGDRVVAHRR